MRKMFLTLLAVFAGVNVANAQVTGGFGVEPTVVITVKEALSLNDDAKVVLQGNIVNNLGDEKYIFKDATGEVVVEIDDEDWMGRKVTAENVVIISGEVDKDHNEPTKIDVDTFTIK